MTKHPMFELHARIPVTTQAHLDEMAAEDAAPHKPDRGRWLTDMIEAEYARRHPASPSKPAKKGKAKR